MARLVWEYATEDEDDEQGDDALDMMLDDDEDLVQHQEHPAADPPFTRYVERIRATRPSWATGFDLCITSMICSQGGYVKCSHWFHCTRGKPNISR
jgi:hypothetical protein